MTIDDLKRQTANADDQHPHLAQSPLSLKALAKDGGVFDAEHLIVAERREGRWSFAASICPSPMN